MNPQKVAEILFENSENIPENVYLCIMNLIKLYHENKNNEEEIRKYILLNLSPELYLKFEKHITSKKKIDIFKILSIFSIIITFVFLILILNHF